MFFSLFSILFISSGEKANIIFNIIYTTLFCVLISYPDIVLRIGNRGFTNIHIIVSIVLLLLAFISSFTGCICQSILVSVIFLLQIGQLSNMWITSSAIDPLLILQFFKEAGDAMDMIYDLIKILPPFVILYALLMFIIIKYREKQHFSPMSILIIALGITNLFLYESKKNITNSQPKPTRQTIRNSLSTFAFFITHCKSLQNVDTKLVDMAYKKYEVTKINKENPRLIVVFWGESTNAKDMSVINTKQRETTPLLSKFSENNNDHFIAMTAMSNGVATMSSTPLFFNIVREPGNTNCLKQMSHNLFKMARDNGYTTHWLGSQGGVYAEASSLPVDDFRPIERHLKETKSIHDDYLLEMFRTLNLKEGKHLIVIQPRSLHLPYYENYWRHRDKFEKYKENRTRKQQAMSEYHNSVLYLDWILNELLTMSVRKGVDYFIITSDHGDMIGEDGHAIHGEDLYGHNLLTTGVTYVPFIMYSKKNNRELLNSFREKGIITHYEISKFVANLIGYDIKNPNEVEDEFFIHDAVIQGDYRSMLYKRENGGIKEIKTIGSIQYMQELAKNSINKSKSDKQVIDAIDNKSTNINTNSSKHIEKQTNVIKPEENKVLKKEKIQRRKK